MKVIKWKEYKVVNFITQFNAKHSEQEFAEEKEIQRCRSPKEDSEGKIGSFDKPSNST